MDKTFSDAAFAQYVYWQTQDRKTLKRINDLLKDIESNGVDKGMGKPELLKHNLSGHWSRRIDEKNRLVYRLDEHGTLRIEYCKGHYE